MNKTFHSKLGENIQKRRKLKKLTQLSLAHATGLDLSHISRIERGLVNITVDTLLKIAKAMDCPIKELLPDEDDCGG